MDRIFAVIGGVCLIVIFVVSFVQVLQRYVFDMSIPWSTDVIRICFIFSVFCGSCVGIIRKAHLNIDVALQFIPEKKRYIFGVVSNVIMCVFLIAVLRYSIPFILANTDQYTPYLEFPMSYVYAVFPVVSTVMIAALAIDTYRMLFLRDKAVSSGEGGAGI
ncbi:MAG: TRAP transporter small permease [Synergistaceae bacterium]|jgi:TRAP-type C4-dicarboxylate transport system permease small subunit|nr:TRAP transporter small permease [Synergistaceae bacterium]